MPASLMADNPFAILTAIVAPAVLTNASSVLALGTANRIARVVDRARVVSTGLEEMKPDAPLFQKRVGQLERLQARSQLLLRALRIFYLSLGSFATAAFVSVVGSVVAYFDQQLAFHTLALIGLGAGAFGVGGLGYGCFLMIHEVRLALQNITEEAEIGRARLSEGQRPVRY